MKLLPILFAILLSLTPTEYRIDFKEGVDEVHLIIWSDSGETNYYAVQSVDVELNAKYVNIPRHYLEEGAYILQAETLHWTGCPYKCKLETVEVSPTTIIHVPKSDKEPN